MRDTVFPAVVVALFVGGCTPPKQELALSSLVPLEVGDKPIFAVAWSPDGSLIGVGTDLGDLMVFDAHSGSLLNTLPRTLGRVTDLAFDRSGRSLLGVSLDGRWCEWDVSTPSLPTECHLSEPPLLGTKFSEHGSTGGAPAGAWTAREISGGLLVVRSRAVTLGDRTVWSPPRGDRITAGAISPEVVVVGTRGGRVYLLDHSGKVLGTARNRAQRVNTVSISQRSELVADGGVDGVLRVSALPDLRLVALLPFETGWITDCDFSPDGRRIVVAGHDLTHRPGVNRVRVWNVPVPRGSMGETDRRGDVAERGAERGSTPGG